MLTKYVLPTISGDHKDAKPTRVQTKNYRVGEVIGKHIGLPKQCWSKLME
jgi:hypothetical protein